MKYYSITFSTILILLLSCQDRQNKPVEGPKPAMTVVKPAVVKKFDGVVFASKKDLSCGMPLTAGLEDTVHYKGKIYGFCSPECKADFLKDPVAHLRQK